MQAHCQRGRTISEMKMRCLENRSCIFWNLLEVTAKMIHTKHATEIIAIKIRLPGLSAR